MISLQEVLCQRKSALIIIDVQNDFCHPNGSLGSKGLDTTRADAIIPNIQSLIDTAHTTGRPVIFIQNTEDESTDTEAWCCRPDGDENSPNDKVTRRGSWGAEFYGVHPVDGDIVIEKHRFNAFHNTRLDTALRALGIGTVVITGVSSNVCVMTTAFHSVVAGYHVVAAEDACASWFQDAHDFAMDNIRLFVGKVVKTSEICKLWEKS